MNYHYEALAAVSLPAYHFPKASDPLVIERSVISPMKDRMAVTGRRSPDGRTIFTG